MTRPVVCVETRQTYRSFAAAGRAIRADARTIRQAVLRGTKAGGYTWQLLYREDRQALADNQIGRNRKGRGVELEDGRIFPSVAAAARELDVTERALRGALHAYRAIAGTYVRYTEPSKRRF